MNGGGIKGCNATWKMGCKLFILLFLRDPSQGAESGTTAKDAEIGRLHSCCDAWRNICASPT